MNSLHPISYSICDLAQACLCLVFAFYTIRLPEKTRNNRLIFFVLLTGVFTCVCTFIYDCNIDDTPYAIYGEWAIMFSRYLGTSYGLWAAYQFYDNPFRRESRIIVSLYVGLCCLSLFLWFWHYKPLVPQPSYNVLFQLFLFISEAVYAGIIYSRKAIKSKKNASHLSAEERSSTLRKVSFFRNFALISYLFCAIWMCFLFPSFNLISWLAWDYISYILIMSVLTIYFYMYLYSQDASSFQAKLVGVILFIVLIIIGIIPLLLYGDTRFVTISEKEQSGINLFVILVPLTTLFIAFVLPALFRRVILKQLNSVIAAVQSVDEGNLSVQVTVDSNDEVGKLSYHFNRMLISLQQYSGKMNELVEERTQALKQSIHELKITQAQLEQSEQQQSQQILRLNEEVISRTEEINSMKQTLASDFHDETGNLLSAITRQASLLRMNDGYSQKGTAVIDNIIANSNQLYASSRHFLWNLNNDSNDPHKLFEYLLSFGQGFYNSFGISFSAENGLPANFPGRLLPFAPLNLIFIFKEAINNVAKHAGATEVKLQLTQQNGFIVFSLIDDGTWKEPDRNVAHHGLHNMEKRCAQNKFRFAIHHPGNGGTRVEIGVPFMITP